ncbi:MAG TPA: VOC family protein [Planctomycetota bacterium]|nr:VOC family protein [Planctomycetota bacterium]
MQQITPCLWFDGQAEAAAQFYTSIFKRSRIHAISRYGEGMPMPKGTAMTVSFMLEGQSFLALNGCPQYKFTPAISLVVDCKTQKEVDALWDQLSAGGQPGPCAWLTDRFGVSWQIVPNLLPKLIRDRDPVKAKRVIDAMMKMGKIDIAELKRAYQGSA